VRPQKTLSISRGFSVDILSHLFYNGWWQGLNNRVRLMLYYIKSGDLETTREAQTPKEAASSIHSTDLGEVVIVSEKPIIPDNQESETYFLTESLCPFRVVGVDDAINP